MTTIATIRDTFDTILAPGLTYAESPPAARRMEDLQASLQIPVDLAASGFICRLVSIAPDGFQITVTRPPDTDLPTLTATGKGQTWCMALSETYYAMNARLDRAERDLARSAERMQEAA